VDRIDLYWLPLGAGGSLVKFNGKVFEAVQALVARRRPMDLYHAALEVVNGGEKFTIELTPIPGRAGEDRGVVGEGAVGAHFAGRWRIFRYELRCWKGGEIPDIRWAVDSPRRVGIGVHKAERLLESLPAVPMLVWGRDEIGAGEMWNSNSVIAWLLARSGVEVENISPPKSGRAPGWHAGLIAARDHQKDA
jgi:hypothetical protein